MPNVDASLFRRRYRISSTRLQGWNYTNGSYFITICTDRRVPWFGNIDDGIMQLSGIGTIVDNEWQRTAAMRPYVTLGEYVIMPDHFHAIVGIDHHDVIRPTECNPYHRVQWQSGCLGAIIQQFKRACTHRIHVMGHSDFAWQPRFHDYLIRGEREYRRIRRYILENPTQWGIDDHA